MTLAAPDSKAHERLHYSMISQGAVVSNAPLYVKIPHVSGLYRHRISGCYLAVKKVEGKRREKSLRTNDRKIAERRLVEWKSNLLRVNGELEKITFKQLITRLLLVNQGKSKSTRCKLNCIKKKLEKSWARGMDVEVRHIRPSDLDEWLGKQEARGIKNTTYNGYAGFLKQAFDIAVKDRIIADSPFSKVTTNWKRPQTPRRIVPTIEQFEAIVATMRSQRFTDHAEDSADFLEFLGLAGLGQAEASDLTWGDIEWAKSRLSIRRHKTDTRFYVPIYAHLRPLLEKLKAKAGKVSDTVNVFKVKNVKKGLGVACVRLGLPNFSQRNIRQCLIMRLWKAGIDKKLIAKWQGHRDGGQLIMDTYTEVFGADDDAYELQQLAKLAR